MSISGILRVANQALAGGELPAEHNFTSLAGLLEQLNLAFRENTKPSWGAEHLSTASLVVQCSGQVPAPDVSRAVASDTGGSPVTITNLPDVISQYVNPAPGGQGNAYELGPAGQLFAFFPFPDGLIAAAQAGKDVALVSDAGTPGISDPGFPLVREALKEGLPVVPIRGPSAAMAATEPARRLGPCITLASNSTTPSSLGRPP